MVFDNIEIINYTQEKNTLSTKCPYGTKFMVGSLACASCNYTKGINLKEKYVYCTYKEESKK